MKFGSASPPLPDLGTFFGPEMASLAGQSAIGAGVLYLATVKIPVPITITGVAYMVGTSVNGNVRSGLWTPQGAPLASRSTNSAVPGTSQIHRVAFDAPFSVDAGRHLIALVFSAGSTAYQGVSRVPASANAFTFGTPSAPVTPPTDFAQTIAMTTY
jgi:hypothetical protein